MSTKFSYLPERHLHVLQMQIPHRECCPTSCIINQRFSHVPQKRLHKHFNRPMDHLVRSDLNVYTYIKYFPHPSFKSRQKQIFFLFSRRPDRLWAHPASYYMSSRNYYCRFNSTPPACLQHAYKDKFNSLLVSGIDFVFLTLVRFEIIISRTSRG